MPRSDGVRSDGVRSDGVRPVVARPVVAPPHPRPSPVASPGMRRRHRQAPAVAGSSAEVPWHWRWLAGALLALVLLGGGIAWTLPAFTAQTDEPAHVATAWAWAHGEVPRITDERPVVGWAEPDGSGWVETQTYTATHPPLFYLGAGAVLRAAEATGDVTAGVRGIRLGNVALGAAAVVATAALARALLPRRPDVAVAAAGLLVLVGGFVRTSAVVYTDALAVATATAALAVAVRLLRDGPTRRGVALLALLALLAAATRTSGLLVAAEVAVAAAVAPLLQPGPRGRRLRLSAASLLAVAGVVGVGTGWFYLLSERRYGDPTGAAELWRLAGTQDTGATWSGHLTDTLFWGRQVRMLWTEDYVQAEAFGAQVHPFLRLVALGAVVALVVAVVRWAAAGRPRPTVLRAGREVAAVGLLAGHVLVVAVTHAEFVAQGGYFFSRYLFPAVPVLAVACAAALLSLPWRPVRPLPALAGTVLLALATARMVRLGLGSTIGEDPAGLVLDLPDATVARAALGALLVLAAVLHVAALLRAARLAPASTGTAPGGAATGTGTDLPRPAGPSSRDHRREHAAPARAA